MVSKYHFKKKKLRVWKKQQIIELEHGNYKTKQKHCVPPESKGMLTNHKDGDTSKGHKRSFTVGSVVKNLPVNTEDAGLIPGLGRFHVPLSNKACVPQLLSLCSRAWELQLLSSRAAAIEAHVP